MSCSVQDCSSIKGGNLTFFNFPSSESTFFKLWVEICNRSDWSPTLLDSMICELHFHPNDILSKSGEKILKQEAIPKTKIDERNLIKSNSCRVCLNDDINGGLQSIFTFEGEKTIAEQLMFATSIQALKDDLLPQFICIKCFKKIEIACEVKQMCLENDKMLRLSLNCKEESDYDDLMLPMEEIVVVKTENEFEDEFSSIDVKVNLEEFEQPFIFEKELKSKSKKSKSKAQSKVKSRKTKTDSIENMHIEKHERKLGSEKQYTCLICDEDLLGYKRYYKHMAAHKARKAPAPHSCSTCLKNYYDIEVFLKHHCSSTKQTCAICSLEFPNQSCFDKHLHTIHINENLDCRICGKVCRSPKFLHFHLIEHTGEIVRNFTCEQCGRAFTSNRYLKVHLKIHRGKEYWCDYCGRGFHAKPNFQKHILKHINFQYSCDECESKYATRATLKFHKVKVHGMEAKTFSLPKEYNKNNYNKYSNEFQCHLCDLKTNLKANLLRHIDTVHHNVKKFKCEFCDKSFGLKTGMQSHRRVHTGEKPFKCLFENCETRYSDYSSLYKHVQIIHKIIKPKLPYTLNGVPR